MKKILSLFVITTLLVGCYDDEGNYDYNLDQMNDITGISFNPAIVESAEGKIIEFQQAKDEASSVRRIEAMVDQSLADNYDKLHFYWYRTYTDASGNSVTDTIETNGYLDVELPIGKEMQYAVYLQVYDTETTLSRYANFTVKTRPAYKNSLFVLHGDAGSRKLGNIETIGEDTYVYTDAYAYLFDSEDNPFANAEGLSYTTFMDIDRYYKVSEANSLSVYSSVGGALVYNPYGLILKYNSETLFKPNDDYASFVFDRNIQAGDPSNYSFYRVVLSKDGKFYVGNHTPALYRPCAGAEYDKTHQGDYRITAATITANRFVLWDAKNNRFLYLSKNDSFALSEYDMTNPWSVLYNPVLNANVDFSGLEKSPEGLRGVYAYIQYRQDYSESKPYFIFKDEATGEFYRYELTQLSSSEDGKKSAATRAVTPEYSIVCERMENFRPGENLNTIVYNSWFTSNFLFYADGGTVYRYNISNGDKVALYDAPDGYTISVLKFRVEDSSAFSDNLGRYMSIGMNNGAHGAVAEILLNTAADVDKNVPAVFYDKDAYGDRFGNIKDLQFTQIYTYKVPEY